MSNNQFESSYQVPVAIWAYTFCTNYGLCSRVSYVEYTEVDTEKVQNHSEHIDNSGLWS